MKKINCLEGIRAIGCIGIVLCHFRGAFLPDRDIWWVDNTPLKLMTAGNPVVRILFVLSGFVVSCKYFAAGKYEDVPKDMLKRYFRLAPGVIAAELLAYLAMKAGLLFNGQAAAISGSEDFLGAFNQFTPDLWGFLSEAFVTCYLKGASSYVGPLWTMVYEYLGVLLVLGAISACRGNRLCRYLFYVADFLFFSSYYNYFVLGMFLCDVYFSKDSEKLKEHQGICNFLLVAGAYIVCMVTVDDNVKLTRVIFSIGLFMLYMGLLNVSWGERLMGSRIMRAGGRVSFAVYLVHWPVMETFSSFYYVKMLEAGIKLELVLWSDFLLSLALIFSLAYVFSHYVENIGQGAVNYITTHIRQGGNAGYTEG